MDRECESRGKQTRVLTLPNLQSTVVEGQTLEGSNLVEGYGGSRVDEGNELSKLTLERDQGIKDKREHTVMCLSCMYLMLCNTPPLMALHKSSVVVSGWMLPR